MIADKIMGKELREVRNFGQVEMSEIICVSVSSLSISAICMEILALQTFSCYCSFKFVKWTDLFICLILTIESLYVLQDSIPVGCLPSVCQPYVLVATTMFQYWWADPQVNKFEQVSSDDHHMSVAGGGVEG